MQPGGWSQGNKTNCFFEDNSGQCPSEPPHSFGLCHGIKLAEPTNVEIFYLFSSV